MKIPFTNFVLSLSKEENQGPVGRVLAWLSGNESKKPETDLTGYKINYKTLFVIYKTSGDVYSCIREWQQSVGSAGWRLKNLVDPESEVDPSIVRQVDEILNYDITRPWWALKNRIVRDLGVTGNGWLNLVMNGNGNAVIGLQPADPRTMAVVSDEHGEIYRYIQRVEGNTVKKAVSFEPNEIAHFMLDPDPQHELFGFAPMEPVIWDIRSDIAAGMANYFFFENDSTPAVQYVLNDNVAASKELREKAIAEIKEGYKGPKNKGKGGILWGVKEVKTIGLSQKDMEYLGGRRFSTEKVCAAYGVPRFRLGYTDTVNNNNGVELVKGFYEGTIEPLENLIAHVMTRQFLDRIGLKGKVAFEFVKRDFSEADTVKLALEELRSGALTLRQYKKKTGQEVLDSDEAYPNFDSYIVHQGASAVLLEDVGVDPVPVEDPNADPSESTS